MDTEKYVAEALRQLSDTCVYHKLSSDPRWDFERKLVNLVDRAFSDGIIDAKLMLDTTFKKMSTDFLERDYPASLIAQHTDRVKLVNTYEARRQVRHKPKVERLPFVSTYTESSSKIGQFNP